MTDKQFKQKAMERIEKYYCSLKKSDTEWDDGFFQGLISARNIINNIRLRDCKMTDKQKEK